MNPNKPCPFCHSTDIVPYEHTPGDWWGWCHLCSARAPIEYWNGPRTEDAPLVIHRSETDE